MRGPSLPRPGATGPTSKSTRRWSVDLAVLAESVELRRDPGRRLPVVSARLAEATKIDSESGGDIAVSAFRQAFSTGRPDRPGPVGPATPEVRVVGDEAAAALAGALSTPGARTDAVVLDLGAGTLDAVRCAAVTDAAAATATVAGGGALVTLAVAELLQVPLGAAEWAKRGPCERVENPLLVLGEDGSRRFVERALPAATVGSLVAPGPVGPLPFTRTLSPTEWRGLRLRVKRELLGRNVSRCLQALGSIERRRPARRRGGRRRRAAADPRSACAVAWSAGPMSPVTSAIAGRSPTA